MHDDRAAAALHHQRAGTLPVRAAQTHDSYHFLRRLRKNCHPDQRLATQAPGEVTRRDRRLFFPLARLDRIKNVPALLQRYVRRRCAITPATGDRGPEGLAGHELHPSFAASEK